MENGELRTPATQETNGSTVAEGLQPQYVFAPRLVGRLACGELAIEPVLGPVRVAEVRRSEDEHANSDPPVSVRWRDEHGPGTAAVRYPAERSFPVQMPAYGDRLLVRRGIDQARWLRREIAGDVARLVAAHLNSGAKSALHRFMVDGSVDERVYDELEIAAQHRLYAREWVDALAQYCLARQDTGPVKQWTRDATTEAESRAAEWLKVAGVSVTAMEEHANGNGNRSNRRSRYPGLLARKQMKTETAAQLIDAAFLLGVSAARKRVLPAMVEKQFGQPVTVPADHGTA